MFKKEKRIVSIALCVLMVFMAGITFAGTDEFELNTGGDPNEGKYVVSQSMGEDGNPVKITTDTPKSKWGFNVTEEERPPIVFLLLQNVANDGTMSYGSSYAPDAAVTAEGRSSFGFCVEPTNSNTAGGEYSTSVCADAVVCSLLYYGYKGDGHIKDNTDEFWRDTWWCIRKAYLGTVPNWNDNCSELYDYAVSHPLPAGSYCIVFTSDTEQDLIGCVYKAPEVGNLLFQKYDDSGNAISGGSYHVTGNGTDLYITSGETMTGLYPGGYTVTEVTAPTGYVCTDQSTTVYVSAGNTVTAALTNKKQLVDIKVEKYDYETGKTPQGDATLKGAKFEVHQGSETGPVAGTLTTGEDGNTDVLEDQPLGTYYVIETEAPRGYNLNPTPIIVTCEWKVETQRQEKLEANVTANDQVKKGALHITKYYHDSGSDLSLLSGIRYALTLKSNTATVYTETTDLNGELTFTDIPYGTYTLHEVESSLPGHIAHMDDRTIVITEDGRQLNLYIDDERVRAEITVIKRDSEDHRIIAVSGAAFKIIDLNGTKNSFVTQTKGKKTVSEWYTDDTGTLSLNESLPSGDYALIETLAPVGYSSFSGSESFEVDGKTYFGVRFRVSNTDASEESETLYTQTVEIENAPSKGRIGVYKTGEVLTGSHTEEVTAGETYETTTFDYGQAPLPGVTFNVYAKEDIVGMPAIDEDRYNEAIQALPDRNDLFYSIKIAVWKAKYLTERTYYHKGDLVTTIITGADGKAMTGDLYLGEYEVVEVGAPEGHTVGTTPLEVKLSYKGQEVTSEGNIASFSVEDSKQNAEFKLTKEIEKVTGYSQDGDKLRVMKETVPGTKGIYFGLFADEDIITKGGLTAAKKDTLIEVIEVKEDGSAKTSKDIPEGKYYLKELEATEDLVLSGTRYPVSYKAKGNDEILTVEVNNGDAILNALIYSDFLLSKKTFEIYGGEALPGCSYRILTEDGTEIYTALTDENGEIDIPVGGDEAGGFGLTVGTYYLEEYAAPKGILIDHTKYKFVVEKSEKEQTVLSTSSLKEDRAIMGDIKITKLGEDAIDLKIGDDGRAVYDMIPLSGSTFAVRAAEDIVLSTGATKAYKGDIVAYAVSDEKGIAVPTEYSFMNAEMSAERAEEETIEPIDLTKSEDSRILKESHAFLGSYDIYETETDERYRLNDTIYSVVLDCEDNETELVCAEVMIENFLKKGDVTITKTDAVTGEELEGAVIEICRGGEVIFKGKTDSQGRLTVKDLSIGAYSFKESDAPDGYSLNCDTYDFEIKERDMTACSLTDTKIPDTGIDGDDSLLFIAAALIFSAGIMIAVWIRRRRS